MAHAVIRVLRDVFPRNEAMAGFRVDWEMAFRQDPLCPEQAKLHYEAVWNPEEKRVQWIRARSGSFGNKAAIRVARSSTWILRFRKITL